MFFQLFLANKTRKAKAAPIMTCCSVVIDFGFTHCTEITTLCQLLLQYNKTHIF
jgi:hypothetical protein